MKQANEINDEQEKSVRNTCVNFTKALCTQLRKRIPKYMEILKQISIFSVTNTLQTNKDSVIELLAKFDLSCSEIDIIQCQWNAIANKKWKNDTNTTNFWIEVSNYKNSVDENPFKELSAFVISLLVLPFSNADVERLFSTMGIIKTKLRNKMRTKLLCSILFIREGLKADNICCTAYEIDSEILQMLHSSEKYKQDSIECNDASDILEELCQK